MAGYRALRLHAPAGRDAVPTARIETLPEAHPKAGEVVLAVSHSSLNYKDALVYAGRNGIVRDYPRVAGIDLAGTVLRSADPRWREGDAVIAHGLGLGVDHDGGHAEQLCLPGDWLLARPAGLNALDAATLGAAGFTAAISLLAMELNGLSPQAGPVLVTGATGGVASIAIDLFSARGYRVVAVTGKADAHDELRALGAAEVLSRGDLPDASRPLANGRWAGAVDSVGGEMLAAALRGMQPFGVVAAFGNAGGMALPTTVLPFILRGVRLIGITGTRDDAVRRDAWALLAGAARPRHLDRIGHPITLEQVTEAAARMLDGQSRGRAVICHSHPDPRSTTGDKR